MRAFRRRFRARFEGDITRMSVYRGVSEGMAPPGIEFYLPLFYEATAQISDYLPIDAVVAGDADLDAALQRAWEGIGARYEDRRHDIERPLLPPGEALHLGRPSALADRSPRASGCCASSASPAAVTRRAIDATTRLATTAPPDFRLDVRAAQPLAPLTMLPRQRLAGY